MPQCDGLVQHPRQCVCSYNTTERHERLPRCIPSASCAKYAEPMGVLDSWGTLASDALLDDAIKQSSTFLIVYNFQREHVRYWYRADPFRSYLNSMRLISRLIISLRRVGTQLPIHLLMSGERHAGFEQQLVERLGVGVLSTGIRIPVPRWSNPFHRGSFAKLAVLSLIQFRRVVVLDSDAVVLQNVDFLAGVPAPAFVYRFKCYGPKHKIWEMNSGMMVLRPDIAQHHRMVHLMNVSGATIDDGHGGNITLKQLAIGSDLGDQSVWRSFFTSVYELPVALNTFKKTRFLNNASDWANVAILHDSDVHRKIRIGLRSVEAAYRNVTRQADLLVASMAESVGVRNRGR